MNVDKAFHSLPADEVLKSFESSDRGLDKDEVNRRRKTYGKNKLEERSRKSIFELILSQLSNPVIYLLVAAVVVSLIFSDIPEAIAIAIVILLNTGIGFWMEYKAQSSLEALKKMDVFYTRARREGETRRVEAVKLVPGDIIILEAGDLVPADARILEQRELKVDESALTGESLPVEKRSEKVSEESALGDRKSMIYKGTALSSGKTTALVTATGMDTEIGGISRMVTSAGEGEIPLDRKLGKLARRLIWLIGGLSALFFLMGWIAGKDIYLMLQTAIAWTVAAIPEGLPIVASISLARGMLLLARQNVLVRNLSSIETLGETTLILTDKTGTLTKNQLTPDNAELPGKETELTDSTIFADHQGLSHLRKVAVLCNDAKTTDGKIEGDPLDVALIEYFRKNDEEEFKRLKDYEKINEDPFDSDSMYMGTIHIEKDKCFIAAKGASSAILKLCSHYLTGGERKKIDENFIEHWKEVDEKHSSKGLKVIAFAFDKKPAEKAGELEGKEAFLEDMTFIGLAGFIDPVREDIAGAVEKCQHAGIRVVMVTGDHPETAENIAGQVHLLDDKKKNRVIRGSELERQDGILDIAVFARVDPSQKLDIVQHFQEQGEIVGMTGDGVNDTPALKKADIGIAMGKRGTQIAHEVADMVLKDDAFTSIIKAVEQGRIIFENIKKFIIYQLSYHLSEIIIIAGINFTLFKLPLLPLQLLFINLLSDVFPALALGIGKGSNNIMEKPPKDPDEPIMTRKNWIITSVYGIVLSIYIIGAYLFGLKVLDLPDDVCNNIAFFSLAFGQLLHVFNMREAGERIFVNQITRNKYIWMALALCAALLTASYYIPVISNVLSFRELDPVVWLIIGIASILPLVTNQIIKEIWKI